MKRVIYTTVSALALFASAPVLAQAVTQTSASNESTITQTGDLNSATVTQNQSEQTSTISQSGNGHKAKVDQGELTAGAGATVGNTATVTQKARADGGGKAEATVLQQSNNNNATINQVGDGRADIDQGINNGYLTGGNNQATITQTDTNVTNAGRNIAGIEQDGSNNVGTTTQTGDANISIVRQGNYYGAGASDSTVSVVQTGQDTLSAAFRRALATPWTQLRLAMTTSRTLNSWERATIRRCRSSAT